MNVLFVDDQKSVLDGIAAGVHFDGLGLDEVRYATGAAKAMEIMESIPIHILFCDIEMPGEDGLHLIRRTRERFPDMLCILLTSHADFEYARESVRLGCYDYIIQPAPHEQIENTLRRALQVLYERAKKNQIYEIGKRMQTGEMELLDKVTMKLFSDQENEARSALEMLNLMGYGLSAEKQTRLMVFSMEQFRTTESPMTLEKTIYKKIEEAMKNARLAYPLISLSAVAPHRRIVLLIFSANQEQLNLTDAELRHFFDELCSLMPKEAIRCNVGDPVAFRDLRKEYLRIFDFGSANEEAVFWLDYKPGSMIPTGGENVSVNRTSWETLLVSGQFDQLNKELKDALHSILGRPSRKNRALCDLHQQITQMFFSYFYDNKVDIRDLFQGRYSYYDYMNSYGSTETMENAINYMLEKVCTLRETQADATDVERAKTFIMDNTTEPITVKEVADHIGLSAEYFTKLFKKETGQNIKEYITLTKIAAAKGMLERSRISVGMIAVELGYTNFSHFSQVFKKYEGMTPSEYRAKVTGER